jgi:hypothetical protein
MHQKKIVNTIEKVILITLSLNLLFYFNQIKNIPFNEYINFTIDKKIC